VPSPIAVAPEHSPPEPSPKPAAPEPLGVAPLARRFHVTPYRAHENNEIGELMARLPEQAREVLERLRLPAARAVDPRSDLFRDNGMRVGAGRDEYIAAAPCKLLSILHRGRPGVARPSLGLLRHPGFDIQKSVSPPICPSPVHCRSSEVDRPVLREPL
jgi:hypothetical protein